MSVEQPKPEQSAWSAPPIQRGMIPARPTTWPTVLGVIAIVLGSLAFLGQGCGGLMQPLMMRWSSSFVQSSSAGSEIFAAQMRVLEKYLPWQIANGVAAAIIALILLAAGIGLIKRRPWGRNCCLIWAVIKMLYAVFALALSIKVNNELMRELAATTSSGSSATPPMPGGFLAITSAMGVIGGVIGLLWFWALPLFMLVWFNLPHVRREVAGWRAHG